MTHRSRLVIPRRERVCGPATGWASDPFSDPERESKGARYSSSETCSDLLIQVVALERVAVSWVDRLLYIADTTQASRVGLACQGTMQRGVRPWLRSVVKERLSTIVSSHVPRSAAGLRTQREAPATRGTVNDAEPLTSGGSGGSSSCCDACGPCAGPGRATSPVPCGTVGRG